MVLSGASAGNNALELGMQEEDGSIGPVLTVAESSVYSIARQLV